MITRLLRSACATLAVLVTAASPAALAADKPYRILHVMSFGLAFNWSEQQHSGFNEALAGVPVEYRILEMQMDRNIGVQGWIERKYREARALIDEWKPDLVYATDDDVQEHIVKHYVNRDLPFVFSGVAKDPKAYGFVGARNVAGVPERVHIVETLRLLQAAVPGVRRIVLVRDHNPMASAVTEQIKAQLHEVPGVEIVAWETITTFDAYQRVVREYTGKADALWPLSIASLKDAQGKPVSRPQVMRWTFENSRLPDITLWEERVVLGALLAVTVSGREQGLAAGRIARGILVDGKSPASFPIRPAGRGVPMINLARANKLGLKLTSSVLLSAEVIDKLPESSQ